MTSFNPTDDQQAFVDLVHGFSVNDLRKHLRSTDETGAVSLQVMSSGWGLGFAPAAIPEEYGGFADEQPAVTAALAYEELAWGDLSTALHLLTPTMLAYAVRECGSTSQKYTFMPQLCEAHPPALTSAMMEPTYQFNPRSFETKVRAAWMVDQRQQNALQVSMCKEKAGSAVTWITQKAVQLVGPMGYSREVLVEKWMRDAKINDIYEGTYQTNLLIVARRLLGLSREQLN